MNKPLVTIAICNFNRCHVLRRSIQSCLAQVTNRRLIELIVVDDGSTDESTEVITKFSNQLVLISHEENLGIGAASQTALQHATGEYFMRVDSDDYIASETIASYAL